MATDAVVECFSATLYAETGDYAVTGYTDGSVEWRVKEGGASSSARRHKEMDMSVGEGEVLLVFGTSAPHLPPFVREASKTVRRPGVVGRDQYGCDTWDDGDSDATEKELDEWYEETGGPVFGVVLKGQTTFFKVQPCASKVSEDEDWLPSPPVAVVDIQTLSIRVTLILLESGCVTNLSGEALEDFPSGMTDMKALEDFSDPHSAIKNWSSWPACYCDREEVVLCQFGDAGWWAYYWCESKDALLEISTAR